MNCNFKSPYTESTIQRIAYSLLRQAGDDSYIHDPEHEFHPSELPAGQKWHRTERGWSSIEGEPTLSDYQKNQKSMRLSPKDIDRKVLGRLFKIVKREGYDTPNKESLYNYLFKGRTVGDYFIQPRVKNGVLWDTDYVDMVQEAIGGVQKRKTNLEQKKTKQAEHPHIDRQRVRELGYTNDIREGGYITPDGRMIDLSGKREGGQSGSRSYDHREAGGTLGMQEFMNEGNIRMDANSGMIDLVHAPTKEQYDLLSRLIQSKRGEVVIDMDNGLGQMDRGESYYSPTRDRHGEQYPLGTPTHKILTDIKKYFDKHREKKIEKISTMLFDEME